MQAYKQTISSFGILVPSEDGSWYKKEEVDTTLGRLNRQLHEKDAAISASDVLIDKHREEEVTLSKLCENYRAEIKELRQTLATTSCDFLRFKGDAILTVTFIILVALFLLVWLTI